MAMIERIKRILKYLFFDKVGRELRPYYLNKVERRRLKNRNFTIISQNCIGSIMYHDLGQKFLSPTINMKFNPNDFVMFLSNIRYYLDAPISFLNDDRYPFPVGHIGDCFVEFVHFKTEDEVVSKWNERKERINWNNLFVIACDKGMTIENVKIFCRLRWGGRFMMFVTENTYKQLNEEERASGVYVKQPFFKDGSDAKMLNFASVIGHRYYNLCFDYVDFLNNKQ